MLHSRGSQRVGHDLVTEIFCCVPASRARLSGHPVSLNNKASQRPKVPGYGVFPAGQPGLLLYIPHIFMVVLFLGTCFSKGRKHLENEG